MMLLVFDNLSDKNCIREGTVYTLDHYFHVTNTPRYSVDTAYVICPVYCIFPDTVLQVDTHTL